MKNNNLTRFVKEGAVVFIFLLLTTSFAYADHSININTADKETLMALNGIGEVKAQAIIDYRSTNGPFKTKEDITNVSGIGPATYDNIKDHIVVEGGSSTSPDPTPPSSTPTSAPSQSSSSGGASASATEFTVDGGIDRTVIVGADASFMAKAYRNKAAVDSVSYVWNFGDGSTAHGASVLHLFEYAGRYLVIVTGSKDSEFATDRFTVTAEDAQLAVVVRPDGGVEIRNLAASDIDLSRWLIRSAGQQFALPDNSLVLAGTSMRISPNTMHFYASSKTELLYPNGVHAFTAGEGATEIVETLALSQESVPAPGSVETAQTSAPPARAEPEEEVDTPEASDEDGGEEDSATSSQLAAAGAVASSSWKWWMGAFAIAFLGAGSVYFARRYARREWSIIEE